MPMPSPQLEVTFADEPFTLATDGDLIAALNQQREADRAESDMQQTKFQHDGGKRLEGLSQA